MKGQSLGIASAAGTASKWRWVFSGGGRPQPASPSPGSSDLYFTGHEDGRVRVWDVTGNVPGLLTTIPFDSGGPGVRLRAVTCLQVSRKEKKGKRGKKEKKRKKKGKKEEKKKKKVYAFQRS